MTPRIPGKLKEHCPDFPSYCDICGQARNKKVHTQCSKLRQARNRGEG